MNLRIPFSIVLVLLFSKSVLHAATIETPVSFDDRLTIQLIAQEPEIVTPTGVAVDARGRIWVIENNTHEVSKNYKGFPSDRIQIFDDFGPDGRARKITTFADGFKNSMSLLLGKDGAVFFAMRNEILLLRDTKNSGTADERKTVVKLETAGTYPHNGLSGLTLGPDGKLYFGLGENLGKDYSLIGSDGTTLKGGGEGGNIYCCETDGSKLQRIATGFWNPFGMCRDVFGRLFAVDNDPGSRPPCRLLHVVQGGDYGFKFRYGRKGIHPFIAWNGELPGTLPMVSGTGEAPCAVYASPSLGLPSDFRDNLLVTCWGDNVIQRFKLVPDGASFKSMPEELIKGGVNFRPVGMAPAPDGSLVISDWVSSSYPVHGKGRLWRINFKKIETEATAEKKASTPFQQALNAFTEESRQKFLKNKEILEKLSDSELLVTLQTLPSADLVPEVLNRLKEAASAPKIVPFLPTHDPFIFNATINALARMNDIVVLGKCAEDQNPHVRLGALLALRKSGDVLAKDTLPKFLKDSDAEVRRAAMQWVGEEKLTEFQAALDATVNLPMSRELFQAYLAAKSLLSGDKPDKGEYIESQMTQIYPSDKHPAHFRALALRNLRVDHPAVTVASLKPLLDSKDVELRTEGIRALAMHAHPDAQPILRTLAADAALDTNLRASAIAGLARSAGTSAETKTLLLGMLNDGVTLELQREAIRALRGAAAQADVQDALRAYAKKLPGIAAEMRGEMAEQIFFALKAGGAAENSKELEALIGARPANEAEWAALIAKPAPAPSVSAGERIFYHPRGAQCFNCHRIDGRGGNIGPDLSPIGKSDRARGADSDLHPRSVARRRTAIYAMAVRAQGRSAAQRRDR